MATIMLLTKLVIKSNSMCELFAVSSKVPTNVSFSLDEFSRHGGETAHHKDGWGLAFYDGNYAQIFREEKPAASSKWMDFLRNHQHESNCVISHIRYATQGKVALKNTQPYSRELGGQRHVFCHNGNLSDFNAKAHFIDYNPIGDSDSELAFCYLLSKLKKLWQVNKPTLNDRARVVKSVFDYFATLGPANFLYSDGDYLYAYANKRTQKNGDMKPPGMFYLLRECSCRPDENQLTGVTIKEVEKDLTRQQKLVLFSSVPLSQENWQPFVANQLIITKQGVIVHNSNQ